MYALPDVDYEGFDAPSQKYDVLILNYYINLIELLCEEDSQPKLPPRMKRVLMDLFVSLYDQNDEEFIPILQDVVDALETAPCSDQYMQKDINRIKDNLKYFCIDQYANLFGKREELDINNDFIYFDLGKLDEDQQLKNTVMYILSSSIMRKLRVPNRIKYLYIDEASVFHKTKIGAQMIDYFLRLSRSMGGVIILGSQNISDSMDSLASKTIKNSLAVETCMWLKSGHKYLTEVGYSPYEASAIKNLHKNPGHYIEIFRKINNKPMILKSQSNPYLYWLSTNDSLDDALFSQAQEQNKDKSFYELIGILAERYPHGHYT